VTNHRRILLCILKKPILLHV